jgi:outer membrane protein TolC
MLLLPLLHGPLAAGEAPPDIRTVRVLDLETARRIAVARNPSLSAAADRVTQARERVFQARSAYWPRVDADLGASRVWRSDTALTALGNPEDPEDFFTAGIGAGWTLFDGFERKFRNLSARYGLEESREARRDARRLLLSSVSLAYYNAQLQRANITISAADETFNRRQVEIARARERVGTGAFSDVLNFEIQANTARTSLILARRDYQAALYGLAALMGLPDAAFPTGTDLAELAAVSPDEMHPPDAEPLVVYALGHRPDVLQGEQAVKRAASGVGEARAGLYPDVDLGGFVDGERTGDMGFREEDFGGSLVMTFSFNLFEGGNTRARIREAEARRSEALHLLSNLQNDVAAEVRQAVEAVLLSQEQLVLQQANAKLVQQNRDLVEKEYAAGQASLVRLNEAQRDFTQAQSRLALARVALRQSWQNLTAATGKILSDFGEDLPSTSNGEETYRGP